MPYSQSELSRVAIELQRQLQYWEQCYYKLNDKYKCIKAKYDELSACHKCINEDKKDEIESASAKKQKMNSDELDVDKKLLDVEQSNFNDDENRKDPLKYLPEPVAVEILEYLKGKELLTAMEVSKTWRDFIKVQSRLMKKIIFKPTREMCELPLLDEIYNEENFRRYKHFEGPMYLRNKYFIEARPIVLLSSTLETLIIKPNNDEEEDHPYCHNIDTANNSDMIGIACEFPKLRALTYPINSPKVAFDLFESSTFPVLTHLKLLSTDPSNAINVLELKEFLSLFPKLEVVMFDENFRFFEFAHLKSDEAIQLNKNLPNAKAIAIREYYDEVLGIFQESLEKLEIDYIYQDHLKTVLKTCKNLKSLSITITLKLDAECKFERNELLETLMINRMENDEETEISTDEALNCFKDILTALPSLKELRLEYGIITEDILKFIAKNMINLETLICYEISEELQQAFDDIKANPQLYVNTHFDFTDEIDWELIEAEFD